MTDKFNPATFSGELKDLNDQELTEYRRYFSNAREYQEPDFESGGAIRQLADRIIREKQRQLREKLQP